MFIPQKNKLKYKQYHRAHIVQRVSKDLRFLSLRHGFFGLKFLKYGFITSKQLESAYLTLNKILKKKAKIYFYTFPINPLTTKKDGVRMGKGKGKIINKWVSKISAGFILCEIHSFNFQLTIQALKLVQCKLPIPSKIIKNIFKKKN